MKSSSAVPVCVLLAALAACGQKDAASSGDEVPVVAAATAPSIADYAGDYDWVTHPEVGDSVIGRGFTHQNADGSGYSVNLAAPNDTVRFTASIVGDSLIDQSVAYTDPALPKGVGQVTWRMTAPLGAGKDVKGLVTISPVSKPDTVIMRARVEATKR